MGTTILATKKGIVALNSPIKLKLLEIIRKGIASFEELVEQSGRAKSTVSVHLHDLERLNLIEERTFPNDRRKKYFVLNALYLAYSETPLREQYDMQLENIATSALNGESFKEKLFCMMRYGMEAYGIDPNPIMKKLGSDVGIKIGKELKSKDCVGVLEELADFWNTHTLGDMSINNESMLTVQVENCYLCSSMPNVGKTLCSLDEGIMEGAISGRLGIACSVQEVECHGTGHNHCRFVVKERSR